MSAVLIRKLSQAQERLQAGDAAGAQRLCEEVLARAPRNPDALCLLGISLLMTARPRDAIAPLTQALAAQPRHGAALENLGLAHLMLGEFTDAERALDAAAALPNAPASVFMRLGAAILNQGRHAAAIVQLERALKLAADNPDIHLNLGQALAGAGDVAAARRQFEAALRLAPDHADAMYNLGVICLGENDLAPARQWFERVLAQVPQHLDAMVNLGVALQQEQRLDDALAYFQRALGIEPGLAQARTNLANVLVSQGKTEAAREQYLAALRSAPALLDAHEGLAAASFALGRFREAIVHLREVLRAEPGHRSAANALAEALFQVGELAEAEVAARRATELDPAAAGPYGVLAEIHSVRGELDRAVAILEAGFERTGADSLLGTLTFALRRLCAWDKWRTAWQRLIAALEQATTQVSPFSLLCEPTSAAQQLAHARRWSTAQFGALVPLPDDRAATSGKHPRLRIGYLSSDYYEHATAYLLAEVLELHDRERFEVFAYAYGPDDHSPMRARLRNACEHFIDIARDPDDIAARRIHADDLDILIDLKGHTMGARGSLLARRLCPIQVSWIGYPGTMGAAFIDYLIADPFVIPPEHEQFYAERVLRLPHCYQPNDRQRSVAAPLTRAEYGLPDDAFVFCCFNQAYKITPEIFAVWMTLLREVPGSVLWLLDDNPWAAANLVRAAQTLGVASERLVFAPKLPLAQHLARYRAADLALDTFPYTSHTTASDALWGDCLLVALCGETFAARVSGSILSACGLPELVTYALADYAQLTLLVATDQPFRDALRVKLQANKLAAPLFDSRTFTRDLEQLYSGLAGKPV